MSPRPEGRHGVDEMTTDAEGALYVYGVVAADGLPPARPGIDGRHPLELVAWKNLRAVTSEVLLREFGEAPLQDRLQDQNWLAAALCTHEAIVEEVMQRQTILPCKFATIYRSAARVQDVLEQHYQPYLEALTYLRDKEEWGVKAYADEQSLRTHLLTSDASLCARHESVQQKPPGLAYLLQKNLDRALTERLEETLVHLTEQIAQAPDPACDPGHRGDLCYRPARHLRRAPVSQHGLSGHEIAGIDIC